MMHEMLLIRIRRPPGSMCRPACWATKNWPLTLMEKTRSMSSPVTLSRSEKCSMPALL